MANFVRHEPCPNCGSTDNLAIYDDGSYHCFSDCGYTKPSQEYIEANAKSAKTSRTSKVKTKVNTERNIMEETVKSTKPAITEEKAAEIKASTSIKGNGFRGLKDEYSKLFGVRYEYSEDGEVIAQYYPCTQEGNLTGYKVREVPKNFRSIGRTGADCELFGQFKFNRGGKYILLVEGELCALSAYQMFADYNKQRGSDYEIAVVSPTTGANSQKQIAAQYKFLDSFEQIILAMDNDEAGKKAEEKIIKVLPKGKVKIMQLRYKDSNEYLEAGKGKEFIQDFYNAKSYTPVGVLASSEIYDKIISQSEVAKISFPPFMGELNKIFPGGHPLSHILNIAADTGQGKTTLVNSMIEYWIFNCPHKIGVVSMELDAGQYGESLLSQYIHRKLSLIESSKDKIDYLKTDQIKKKADELFKDENGNPRFFLLDNRDGSVEEIQDAVEELVISCNCKVIVLDPLQDVLDGLSNEEQALFMKWAKGFIKSHGVLFVFINHMRKSPPGQSGADSEQNIMGSSTIIKSASANILLKRDKMSEDPIIRNKTDLVVTKNRVYGITGPAGAIYYDNETHRLHNFDTWMNENS